MFNSSNYKKKSVNSDVKQLQLPHIVGRNAQNHMITLDAYGAVKQTPVFSTSRTHATPMKICITHVE